MPSMRRVNDPVVSSFGIPSELGYKKRALPVHSITMSLTVGFLRYCSDDESSVILKALRPCGFLVLVFEIRMVRDRL